MDLPTPDSLRPGHLVGPWRVEGYGGRGTYGVVFRARRAGHPGSLPVALKLALFPQDPRFNREMELLSRLRHPAIPRLLDRGWWHSSADTVHPYLVMEWIRGLPLYQWARVHSATQRQVLRVVAQVAWGLEVLHRSGGLHRDVKGDNILVEPEGRALLTDFGSGTWAGAPPLTERIMAPGTPEYRSREAHRFQWAHWREKGARYEARPADDLYALGVSLYKLVTGMYPPPGTDPEAGESARNERRLLELQPQDRDVQMLPGFVTLIEQVMAREPTARGEAREVAEAAESLAERAGAEADVPLFGMKEQAPEAVSIPVPWEPRGAASEQLAPNNAAVPPREAPLAGDDWPTPELLDAPVHEEAWVSDSKSSKRPHVLWSGLAAAAVLLAMGIGLNNRRQSEEAPEIARTEALGNGAAPDAGTRGLGDSTPITRVAPERLPDILDARIIATELPDEPLPGQRRAPCRGNTVAINGGCWHLMTNTQPPCGDDAYEWKGSCYYPILDRVKPRTSKKPR
ncbi:serine/threonine-protein kinase [Hyalangium versicolor]|uniref:serine/threonine-protein kinase n=1 Tax=Hyalangium versicolor TaxID=2861190 RepID=UPI001CCB2847|nr:serine/threonine-protein kinase [Hyalangium versicolor]